MANIPGAYEIFNDIFKRYQSIYPISDTYFGEFEGPVQIGEKLILSHEPLDCNWAFNIHGHVHNPHHKNDIRHLNVCADAIQYTPINLSQWLKTAPLKPIQLIHHITINNAAERCAQK